MPYGVAASARAAIAKALMVLTFCCSSTRPETQQLKPSISWLSDQTDYNCVIGILISLLGFRSVVLQRWSVKTAHHVQLSPPSCASVARLHSPSGWQSAAQSWCLCDGPARISCFYTQLWGRAGERECQELKPLQQKLWLWCSWRIHPCCQCQVSLWRSL